MLTPAEQALELAFADPHRALTLGRHAARVAGQRHDALEVSRAQQAVGLALRCLQRPGEAVVALRRAARTADQAGLVEQRARVQVGLALALTFAGRGRHALSVLDAAERSVDGHEAARVQVQRGTVLHVLGRPADAAAAVHTALPLLRHHQDRLWQARAGLTLGLAQVELGRFAEADASFAAAETLFAALGQRADAAGSRHNRGWCAALLGDVPVALAHYEQAEQRFAQLDLEVPDLRLDRARVLLTAGLGTRADAEVRDLLAGLGPANAATRGDALLVLAEAALATGDPRAAAEAAAQAERLLHRQRRPGRAALAAHTAVQARWLAGDRDAAMQRAATRSAGRLAAQGLAPAASESRLIAARVALERGHRDQATPLLRSVAAGRGRGAPRARSLGWLAEGLLRQEAGDDPGATRALRRGLRILDVHRASLGATELRVHTALSATELVRAGRRIAVRSGRPAAVLRWSEYGRASVLSLPATRPPQDPALAIALAELRRLAQASGPAPAHRRRQADLRDEVRRRSLATPGAGGPARRPPTVGELSRRLGDRVLVSLSDVDGVLHGVTVRRGLTRLHRLAPMAGARTAAEALLQCLRRVVQPDRPPALVISATAAFDASAARLDDLLLAPMRPVLGRREVVLIAPPELCALPWSALPSLAGRALTVAPSAAVWCRRQDPARIDRVVAVAGPGLRHADAEVARVAATYPQAVIFTSTEALVPAVLAALDGADLAHLAAHGDIVRDNPLFSALRLTDGPLLAFDLERLRRPPRAVVLSACDSMTGGITGEEMLGLATALLAVGTATVLGCVAPLSDDAAPDVLGEVHQELARGSAPRHALARARSLPTDDPVRRITAQSFLAFGGG